MPIPAGFTNLIVPYVSLILLVGVGVFSAWRGLLNQERINMLSEIIIVLILPFFTFWNAATGSVASVLNQAPWMVGLGLCSGLIGYSLATGLAWFAGWERPRRSVLQVSGVSGNTGFLGIPVCTALYGSQGAILALLYDLGASIYMVTVGLNAYQDNVQSHEPPHERLRLLVKQLVSPIFIALLVGLGVALVGWDMPAIMRMPLEGLSNTAIPFMMIILGGIIYHSAIQFHVDKGGVFLLSFLKLLIMPCLTLLIVQFLPIAGIPAEVAVIEAAMPCAVVAVTFAARYHADENLAASATMLTTLMSVLTIPMFAAAVK